MKRGHGNQNVKVWRAFNLNSCNFLVIVVERAFDKRHAIEIL